VLEVRDDPARHGAAAGPVVVLLDAGARAPLVALITHEARDGLCLRAGSEVRLLAKVRSFRVIAALR
jgi:hypothetical protein